MTQELPYRIAAIATKTLINNSHTKVWPRNSFVTKKIVAAMSDLDLTIIITKIGQEKVVTRKYKFLKIIFPFLGEMNIYDKKPVLNFIELANSYELDRDPHLLEEFSFHKKATPYEKIVFFCKILESDQENLKSIPEYRRKKWEKHLRDLNINSAVGFDHLKDALSKLCHDQGIDSTSFLDDFFMENRTEKINCDNFYRNCKDKRSYILLYPFRWIGSSLTCESFYHDIELLKDFSNNELKLLEAQISWEIWGLFSQYLHNIQNATLHTHLENIKQVMESNDYLRKTLVYKKLNEFRVLHENWLIHHLENGRP